MNGLIKQLLTPSSPVAQLAEHKTISEKELLAWVRTKGFCKYFVLIFTK